MTLRSRDRVSAAAWAGLLLLSTIGSARAQDTRIEAVIEQIAGVNLYLTVGAARGLATNDTLFVYAAETDEYLGAFLVISTTQERSAVVYAGSPFAVTRGKPLLLRFSASHVAPVERDAPDREIIAGAAPPPKVRGPTPSLSGRFAIEASAFESKTRWEANQTENDTRRFATPSAALRAVIADLPGGFNLSANLRASYRYSSDGLVQPQRSVRVYQASVGKAFGNTMQLEVGRFNNPYEYYSGYWDGLMVHFGRNGFGGGVAAGYEPVLGNEGVSTEFPKYTAFLNYRHRTRSVGYHTDLSFHQVRPQNGLLTHTFAGWSQRLRVRRVQLSNDIQIDRNPDTDSWTITRLQVRTSLPLGPVDLHARVSMLQPYSMWSTQNVIAFRRDQASMGVSYWTTGGFLSFDVAANRFNEGSISYTYSTAFGITKTSLFGLGWNNSASYGTRDETTTLYLSSGLNRSFGRTQTRASYQLYRTASMFSTFLTHTADLSLSLPLARRVYTSIEARRQWGQNLLTSNIYMGFWTSF
jgi:hypothetical protein